jgi:hypothetical protein
MIKARVYLRVRGDCDSEGGGGGAPAAENLEWDEHALRFASRVDVTRRDQSSMPGGVSQQSMMSHLTSSQRNAAAAQKQGQAPNYSWVLYLSQQCVLRYVFVFNLEYGII